MKYLNIKKTVACLCLSALMLSVGADVMADETIVPYMGGAVVGTIGVKRVIWGTGNMSASGDGYISLYQGGGGVPSPQVGYAVIGLPAGETVDITKCLFFLEQSKGSASGGALSILEIGTTYLRVRFDGHGGDVDFSFQIVEFG